MRSPSRTRSSRFLILGLGAVLLLLLSACGTADDETDEVVAPDEETEADQEPEEPTDPDPEVAEEDEYPTGPIDFIIPFPAGSANDTAFRTLIGVAQEELGVRITVINREGGAGTIGIAEMLASEPDGYTIGMAPSAAITMLPEMQDTTYSGPEDVTPVLQAYTAPLAVFAKAGSEIETVEDFVERSQQDPPLLVGVPCEGCVLDLDLMLLMDHVGGQLDFVVTQAGEQAVQVINETTDLGIGFTNLAQPFVESGELQIVGIFNPGPVPGDLGQVFSEEGYPVDVVPSGWLIGPPDLPDNVVRALHDAFEAAVQSDEFAEFAERNGLVVAYADTEELVGIMNQQTEDHRRMMAEVGFID